MLLQTSFILTWQKSSLSIWKSIMPFNDYIEEKYRDGVNNYLMIDEFSYVRKFELAINSLHSDEKYDIYLTLECFSYEQWSCHTVYRATHGNSRLSVLASRGTGTISILASDYDAHFERYIKLGGLSGSYTYKKRLWQENISGIFYDTILIRGSCRNIGWEVRHF